MNFEVYTKYARGACPLSRSLASRDTASSSSGASQAFLSCPRTRHRGDPRQRKGACWQNAMHDPWHTPSPLRAPQCTVDCYSAKLATVCLPFLVQAYLHASWEPAAAPYIMVCNVYVQARSTGYLQRSHTWWELQHTTTRVHRRCILHHSSAPPLLQILWVVAILRRSPLPCGCAVFLPFRAAVSKSLKVRPFLTALHSSRCRPLQ